ncbi:hypothetical protein HA402_002014 [Bradysia odoriphaga]|nr:hypothetical protein HA402_002014 [Bradysia odoriphaga]
MERATKKPRYIATPYVPGLSERINKSLRDYDMALGCKVENNVGQILTKTKSAVPKLMKSKIVYRVDCMDCDSKYPGQTKQRLINSEEATSSSNVKQERTSPRTESLNPLDHFNQDSRNANKDTSSQCSANHYSLRKEERQSVSYDDVATDAEKCPEELSKIPGSTLGIDAMVTVETGTCPPLNGVIRAIFKMGSIIMVGVEIEEFTSHALLNLTDGTFSGHRFFQCQNGKALFIEAKCCHKDTRFSDDFASENKVFGYPESQIVKENVPPLSLKNLQELEDIIGESKGIQGYNNSSYLDATLFSMFSFAQCFDSMLYRSAEPKDIKHYDKVRAILRDEIVHPLRKHHFVRADRVLKLRELLEEISTITEEKDPEEFLNILIAQTLKADPYLKSPENFEVTRYLITLIFRRRISLHGGSLPRDVKRKASNILLRYIKYKFNVNVPIDYRTLLKTPVNPVPKYVAPGSYMHVGVQRAIYQLLSEAGSSVSLIQIKMQFFIDGLQISRSTNDTTWLIMVNIRKASKRRLVPKVIGAYYGESQLTNFNEFLWPFVMELLDILDNGIPFNGNVLYPRILNFVLDAKARVACKAVKSINGYEGCDVCLAEGESIDGRMAFLNLESDLRNDHDYRTRVYDDYHHRESVLELLPIDMIDAFPLDYLHCVLLGVTNWLLGHIRNTPQILSSLDYDTINDRIEQFEKTRPTEFQHKLRSFIDHLGKMKGTEFRQYLLFVAPLLLKGIIDDEKIANLLKLHIASIIFSHKRFQKYYDEADKLMRMFIVEFSEIYHPRHVVYVFHSLCHMKKFVVLYGPWEQKLDPPLITPRRLADLKGRGH